MIVIEDSSRFVAGRFEVVVVESKTSGSFID